MSRWVGRTASGRTSEYVRLLHLAATTGERRVEATLRARLNAGDPCDYASVQAQVRPPVPTVPVVHVPRPDLASRRRHCTSWNNLALRIWREQQRADAET